MDKRNKPDIYYYSNNFYVENLMPGQDLVFQIEKAGWYLDFALNGLMEINEIALAEGYWRLSYIEIGKRILRNTGVEKSEILTVVLHENTYADAHFDGIETTGEFHVTLAFPILKIISCLKNPVPNIDANLRITGFVQLLIAQMRQPNKKERKYKYRELKNIHEVITDLENVHYDFPLPAELIRRTRMHKSRFQNACLALYGQSAQKIIHHFKMTRAFDAIAIDKETITNISSLLGYRHSPNFITAFREHFSVTPMEVLQTR